MRTDWRACSASSPPPAAYQVTRRQRPPGAIHEGGDLGYTLAHGYGAVFDNPDLLACCIVGDGEAETGPLAASWHANKFLNPIRDGAVLPILHLNGYKSATPALLARLATDELGLLMEGYGYHPHFVEGTEPLLLHQRMAAVLDKVVQEIHAIQRVAREQQRSERPRWPVIVLQTPKGWTGPQPADTAPSLRHLKTHQRPLTEVRSNPQQLASLEAWLRSYRPEELFDDQGALLAELAALSPKQYRRMSANPHANGGLLARELALPEFGDYAQAVPRHGATLSEPTRVVAGYLADVVRGNPLTFRLFAPDETAASNMDSVLDATAYAFNATLRDDDEDLSPEGRLMEILSEHVCQGWLEGYLLTGRHGLLTCSEAFIHEVDSMFNQHAKWLMGSRDVSWRRPIASLTYLLSSLVWRQSDSGFSHQDPGFIDHVVNKKAEIIRVYLPPDANCLLSVADHCLRSWEYVNVILAGKSALPNWLSMEDAVLHCTRGLGIWDWASNDEPGEPDVVLACCGDVATLETLAAVALLREHLPTLKVRVVNVVDLMRLQPSGEHPHGLSDAEFDAIFTTERPIVFAYHGYPWLIHRLAYRRANHHNIHVRGYKEEGTTTTPFDLVMRNDMDRFHLVVDVIDRVPGIASQAGHVRQRMVDRRHECQAYARREGEDMPEIRNWSWPG